MSSGIQQSKLHAIKILNAMFAEDDRPSSRAEAFPQQTLQSICPADKIPQGSEQMGANMDASLVNASLSSSAQKGLAILIACAVLISAAFHWRDMQYPACDVCDATHYGSEAQAMEERGLFVKTSGLRTLGYPAFISAVMSERDFEQSKFGYFVPKLAIAQTLIFIAAALALFFAIKPASEKAAWCAAIGLLANPFVLNYVPLRMTEGLVASLLVLLVAIVCYLTFHKLNQNAERALTVAGTALASTTMIVRPACFVFVIAWAIFVVVRICFTELDWRRLIAACLVALALPLLVQASVNYRSFDKFTPLPAIDLGQYQLALGMKVLKYTTNLSGTGNLGLRYRNPFFAEPDANLGRTWYIASKRGLLTAGLHMFASIDHDYFFIYIYDLHPPYRIPVNALWHVILFGAAVTGIAYLGRRARAGPPLSVEDGPWLFLLSGLVLTLALNSIITPETRFGIYVYALAGPLALWGLPAWWSSRYRTAIAAVGIVYVTAAVMLSDWFVGLALKAV